MDLGTLGGPGPSYALGINNAGEVVGNYAAADGYVRSFSFSNGLATDLLGALATSSSSSANGINDAGQVVGSYSPGNSGPPHAFIYSNGQIADLGTLGGSYSSSVGIAINNVEQVAGTSTTFYGATHAFSTTTDRWRILVLCRAILKAAPPPSTSWDR
jgi:probable HAF family extracellular repeat protein